MEIKNMPRVKLKHTNDSIVFWYLVPSAKSKVYAMFGCGILK